jgi:hypothetical protein
VPNDVKLALGQPLQNPLRNAMLRLLVSGLVDIQLKANNLTIGPTGCYTQYDAILAELLGLGAVFGMRLSLWRL